MAPRRTAAKSTDDKATAEKVADDNKNQETAAEQQAKDSISNGDTPASDPKPEEKKASDDSKAETKAGAPKVDKKDAERKPDTEKVDITKGTENREPIPAPEQHQDRAMNEVDRQVSNAATVGVEGLEEDARKRMLQVAQIDTSSPSGYVDVFRAMANPPENAVKAAKAEAESVKHDKN